MLEVKNACFSAGEKNLFADLSFTLNAGAMACIVGESGCGKTSLLRCLMGFARLDSGFISYDGELLTPHSAETFRRQMAYLPQELALLSYQKVSEMVALPFQLRENRHLPFSKRRLQEEMERLHLAPETYDKKVAELSGGERQRVMLAVCGLLGKRYVFVDEPTSALERQTSELVSAYLRRMAEASATVLAVTHDEVLAAHSDLQIRLV